MIGRVLDADWDYSSPYITSGYTSGDLRSYVLTWDGSDYRIYRLSGLRTTSITETLQATFSASDNDGDGFGQIRSSKTTANFALCVFTQKVTLTNSVRYSRTTDGSTWTSATTIGAAGALDTRFGVSLEGSTQLVCAQSGTSSFYSLWRATTTGGAFSEISPNLGSTEPIPMLQNNGAGDAYATQIGTGITTLTVNFDDPTPSQFTLSYNNTFPGGTSGVGGGGNPGNCANFSWTSTAAFTPYAARVNLTATTIVYLTKVRFQVRRNNPPPLGTASGIVNGSIQSPTPSSVNTTWTTHEFTLPSRGFLNVGQVLQVGMTFVNTSAGGAGSCFVDNIEVIDESLSQGLYRIDSYGSAPSIVDVTPSGGFIPRSLYALSADGSDVSMIAEDDDGYIALYESANDGGTWTDRGSTVYSGIKRAGSLRLAFGDNRIALSENGVDWFSKYGEYGAQVATGEVQGILVLL